MNALAARLEALRRELTRALRGDDDPSGDVGAEIGRVLTALERLAAAPPRPLAAPRHRLSAHLEPAVQATAAHFPGLANALAALADDLPWAYSYAPRADLPGQESRMGWFELVGPAAPLRSHEVCLGLTLLAPETVYPAHSHPAVELYRIVAGRPRWTIEGEIRALSPPAIVLHRSGVSHAMASGDEALLAIYSWTGDILSPSIWADSARRDG